MEYVPKDGSNRIRISSVEYCQHLDDFLTSLGIRSRAVAFDGKEIVIESENVYMDHDKEEAERLLTKEELIKFKLEPR